MPTEMTRINQMNDTERELVNLLSPEERKVALIEAGKNKVNKILGSEMMTCSDRIKQAITKIGGRTTNQGNPKRITFTMPSGTTLDDVTESIAEVQGYVIRRDGMNFVAVDISK